MDLERAWSFKQLRGCQLKYINTHRRKSPVVVTISKNTMTSTMDSKTAGLQSSAVRSALASQCDEFISLYRGPCHNIVDPQKGV